VTTLASLSARCQTPPKLLSEARRISLAGRDGAIAIGLELEHVPDADVTPSAANC
jgi:hypothetical protein